MRFSEQFPSKYLRAADLQGSRPKVTIARIESENMGDDGMRPVVYFRGKEKGLVLNKTNGTTLSDAFGDEMDDCLGKTIELYTTKVDYQGRRVEAIRIDVPRAAPAKTIRQPQIKNSAPAPQAEPAEDDLSIPDENVPEETIPF